MRFPAWHQHFLGLTNQDLGLDSENILGVVYGSGLVCMRCKVDLSAGVIVKPGQHAAELLGQDCADGYAPDQWFNAMQIGKYYLNSEHLRADQSLKPGQRVVLRGLEVYLQLNPAHAFAQGMRNLLLSGKVLSKAQASTVQDIILEAGDIKAMLIARDQLRRLSILGSLPELSPGDAEKVLSLTSNLLRLEHLSDKQNRMIYALQEKYTSEVLAYTSHLISSWPPIGGWLWKLD